MEDLIQLLAFLVLLPLVAIVVLRLVLGWRRRGKRHARPVAARRDDAGMHADDGPDLRLTGKAAAATAGWVGEGGASGGAGADAAWAACEAGTVADTATATDMADTADACSDGGGDGGGGSD